MQSKRLNKYLGVVLGVITLVVLGLTGFLFSPRNTHPANADTKYLTVQKVFLPDKSVGTVSDPSEFWHIEETALNIAQDDFVLLDTVQKNYTDSSNKTYSGREAIAIHFSGPGTNKSIPVVTVRFNNNLLKINQIKELEGENAGVSTFSQYLFALTPQEIENAGLDECYYTKYSSEYSSENKNVDLPEGLYTIYLKYFDVNSGEQTEEISFYVTTQKTYNQVNQNPTLNHTEKVDAVEDTNSATNIYNQMTATVNYFNFNNIDTTYYDSTQGNFIRGITNPSELSYPTLVYNPKKFDISYTRTLYNYRETVSTIFSVQQVTENGITKDVGYLDVETYTTENPTRIFRRTYVLNADENENFSIKMQFDKVGEYEITKTPKLAIGFQGVKLNFATPTSNIITANQEYLSPLTLIINGYVANYSNTQTTSAPLYDDTYSYNTMSGEINKINDTVYTHDFLADSGSEKISTTTRTRAETIYTADMTFTNSKFVSNSGASTISMNTLRNNIMAYDSTATTSNAFGRFFTYNQATNFISTSQSVTKADGSTYYTKSPSTNLAPVSFDFYGKLYTGNSTQYASWYAYRDTSGNVSVNKYTRGMSFNNAGEYIVYLTYENTIYSNTNQNGSRKNQYMHQIFCFEITNSTPTISIYAQDNSSDPTLLSSESAEMLSIDSYTNNYVYASWENAGPFDAGIYCTYNVYDWNGTLLSQNNALNGLVYQSNKNNSSKMAISGEKVTLLYGSRKSIGTKFGQDGYYQIQVFRTNNSRAFVNYTFSIDTAPISGIKTLQVIGHNLWRENGSSEPTVLSELDYNNPDAFNLICNTSFGFTWSDKTSGAPITAQYVYASINKTANFDLVKAITNSDTATENDAVNKLLTMSNGGTVYMPTNASLGVFTPAMNYTKIKTDTYEDIVATLNDSQIINTAQLAFLLLRDAAGNTAIYATMLDNTNTQVLQVEKQSSYVNVITKDTQFYWGTHKSLTAEHSTTTLENGVVRDVYDFINNYDSLSGAFVWTLNGKSYSTHSTISQVFNDLDITATNSINIPLNKVTITAMNGEDTTVTPAVGKNGSTPSNWYAQIEVKPGATKDDPYTTGVGIDGVSASTKYELENGEFRYQITVWDKANNDNAGGLSVEVNLDKSLGSLRSYWDFDGTDLSYNRNPDKGEITDRQYVANTYSTDRRYVAFSWTEPGEAFTIKEIRMKFYTFTSDINSTNYPYSDTVSKEVVLYDADTGSDASYEDGKLYKINYTNGSINTTYYQTSILRKLIYSAEFENAGASEAGKYVITRTYQETDKTTDLEGDQMVKTYTYYVDRNTILPTNTYNYGDEKLQFGYNKGDYANYPDYPENGSITFDNYGLLTNTEKFEKLSFDTTNISASTPTNVIIKSNILPASVNMSTWTSNGYSIYDKYYTDPSKFSDYNASNPETAYEKMYAILDNYKNSSRLQVAVQFFANNSSAQYSLTSQTFYSTKTDANYTDGDYTYSRPLSDLQYAFREIGRYRVVFFDLANFDGLLTGNAYTDFKKISYSLSSDTSSTKNTLYPNSSVVSFELTGTAPKFEYQASMGENDYGPMSSQNTEQLTNFTKARVTWSDPSDTYYAKNAYNEVTVTKTIIPKGNNTSSNISAPTSYKKYFGKPSRTDIKNITNPIEITSSNNVSTELTNNGLTCIELDNEKVSSIITKGLKSIREFIEEKTQNNTDPITYNSYFFKVASDEILNKIINNAIQGTSLNDIEYYKVRKSDTEKLYNYYLLLPQAEVEDAEVSNNKSVDTRYSVKIHYIAKSAEDYLVFDSDEFYATTKDLYQDYTAPYYNLVDLIENDTFINSMGETFKSNLIKNIDNPEYTFLKSYAFAVKPGFSLSYRNKYESSSYYYYRKYNDYSGDKQYQTVTATNSKYPKAPIFSKADPQFTRATYSGLTGFTAFTFTETGYYDIIEQDNAGNTRVYTIFVSDDSFSFRATNDDMIVSADNSNIQGKVYNSAKFTRNNNNGFTFTNISSADKWLHLYLTNGMNPEETQEFYLVPEGAYSDIEPLFDNEKVSLCTTLEAIKDKINEFISDVAFANDESQDRFGSQILFYINSRLDNTNKHFTINTPGKMLINSEDDFLSLITINSNTQQFTLKMPDTTNILSTKVASLSAYVIESNGNTIPINQDSNYITLPTTAEEFESDFAINTGYSFGLANNIVYKFEFWDNFGRSAIYSYPVDSSLIKELIFSGGTKQYEWTDGNTYTYTSNDVDFRYQTNGLNIALDITNMNDGRVLYQKAFSEPLDTENKYFTYIIDSISNNIATIRFNADRSLNNKITIQVNNGTDVITKFEFVMYTVFPQIVLSDVNGSPIQNYLTSKEVMLTWTPIENALFNPYVELVYPDETVETIESGFTIKPEGTYTVRCANDLGPYTSRQIVFTIQEYLISIYGVYQITSSGQAEQLKAFSDSYKYTTQSGKELAISQYMFLSNDSNWERNISVICNEDKDLAYEIVETFGNTRIYRVYGKDKGLYQLEIYFAVTRIPSLSISKYTNFRINNDSTTRSAEFKTQATTITWTTTYNDSTATGRTITYPNFFSLELKYNGTYVGTYTSGKLELVNSGLYTISIADPVGQKHYFGANANSTTFELTILTNVIYYVNDNASIPYATYSDDVDFYIPQLEYYDYTPVVQVYRNNSVYEISPNETGHYIFSTPGSYKIVMKTAIERAIGTVPEAQLQAMYQFVIVSPNEAIPTYDFTPIAGYEIINIVRLDNDTDITAEVRGDNAKITSLHIDPENLGVGKYQITVQTEAKGYIPSQTYTFSVWVNNETVILTPSREWGSSSIQGFTITVNPASIYERIGECQIMINGSPLLAINDSNKNNVDPITLERITAQGDYIVQLVSASGTVLQSYRMTILEPLNTAAIILIVVAVVVVVVLAIVFIIMRRKVRVR